MFLLQVVLASRRLVRTLIAKQLCQVCVKGEERSRPKRCANIKRQTQYPQNPLAGSWIGRARRKTGSTKTFRSWGRQAWRSNIGKREIQMLLLMRSNRSSSPNDYSYNRRIKGLVRLKETKLACMENWKWGVDSSERIKQGIAKTLKNWGEFVAKKQIERDKQELMNCLCIMRGILRLWVNCWLKIRFTEPREFLVRNERTLRSWNREQRAALERPTFPVNTWAFRVPEPCLAAILDCRTIHRMLWVLQETFFESLLAREGPPSVLFENSRNLASYSQELRPDTAGNTKRHVHFRRRVSVEEQRAQKYDRFLRGRQIAYMIYEHCRATGAYEAVQGVSDFINIRLENDDFQDFDVRWDQAVLSASDVLSDVILEGLYKSKYKTLSSFRPCWLCLNKIMFETMGNRVIQDWRHL